MINSYINAGAQGNINIETADTLRWGSDIEYAVYHERGTGRIHQREVLGLLDERDLDSILDDWAEGLTNG